MAIFTIVDSFFITERSKALERRQFWQMETIIMKPGGLDFGKRRNKFNNLNYPASFSN